jgi:hypothetical protein
MTVQLRRWAHRFKKRERTKFDLLDVHRLGEALRLGNDYGPLLKLRNELNDGCQVMITSHKFAVIIEKAIAAHRLWKEGLL